MNHIHRWNQHLTQFEFSFHRWFDFDSDFGLFHSAVPADRVAHYYSLLAAIFFVALLPQCYFYFGLFHSAVPADRVAHYYSLLAAILFVALLPQCYFYFGLFHSADPADPADRVAHYYSLLAAILFVALLPQCYFYFGLFHSAVPADLHYIIAINIFFLKIIRILKASYDFVISKFF